MRRSDDDRLRDILIACDAIERHVHHADAAEEIVFDALRMRILEIGEAVKDVSASRLKDEPEIPWKDIAAMRDQLAHRYFDTEHAIVFRTARHDIPQLRAAVHRLLQS